ncbi:MAG: hypothetical protein AAF492_22790, partial [Verrucomicrobiota bacterium]
MADVQLQEIRDALAAQDPGVVELMVALASEPLPHQHPDGTPYREGALTFYRVMEESRGPGFRQRPEEEQHAWRTEQFHALEADEAEIPLPDRLQLHHILIELWEAKDVFSRSCLIAVLERIPLTYGAWRAIKQIFKAAETARDTRVYALLSARFDMALNDHSSSPLDAPTRATLRYLCRR